MNKSRSHPSWFLAVGILVLSLQGIPQVATAGDKTRALEFAEQKAFQQAASAVADAVVQLRYVGNQSIAPVTGVIVAPGGWIVTSLDGLEDRSTKILVTFFDGSQSTAKLVARDFNRHLALLRADNVIDTISVELQPAPSIQPGQWAIAVGRTHRADQVSLSVGVVSATHRFGGKAVQTDAAVSPSNYGGPLVNLSGQVIGIMVPMAPQGQKGTDWYDSGIGFAVPLDQILDRLERMQAGHDIRPGQLGLTLAPGDPLRTPPVVSSVAENGPIASIKILSGDRILRADDKSISTIAQFRCWVEGHDAGDQVKLLVEQKGIPQEITVTLAQRKQQPGEP